MNLQFKNLTTKRSLMVIFALALLVGISSGYTMNSSLTARSGVTLMADGPIPIGPASPAGPDGDHSQDSPIFPPSPWEDGVGLVAKRA